MRNKCQKIKRHAPQPEGDKNDTGALCNTRYTNHWAHINEMTSLHDALAIHLQVLLCSLLGRFCNALLSVSGVDETAATPQTVAKAWCTASWQTSRDMQMHWE